MQDIFVPVIPHDRRPPNPVGLSGWKPCPPQKTGDRPRHLRRFPV